MKVLEKLTDTIEEALREVEQLRVDSSQLTIQIKVLQDKKDKILKEVKECEEKFNGVSAKVYKENEKLIKELSDKENALNALSSVLDKRGVELRKKEDEVKTSETDSRLRYSEADRLMKEANKVKIEYIEKANKLKELALV